MTTYRWTCGLKLGLSTITIEADTMEELEEKVIPILRDSRSSSYDLDTAKIETVQDNKIEQIRQELKQFSQERRKN